MRRNGMKSPTATLTAIPLLATTLLLAGCASSSSSTGAGASTSAPASSAPVTSAPVTSSAGSSAAAPSPGAGGQLPTSGTSAALTYLGPKTAKPVRTAKTVTGATYQRLADDLNALRPAPTDTAQCMVITGENATVTVTAGGHTWVFSIDGATCRPVSLTKDGVQQAKLANSMTLLNQIRAIAGFTGMAHPLTG
jgi:hypothetical protein